MAINLTRPGIIKTAQVNELRRWNQHTTDNIERLRRNDGAFAVDVELTHGVEVEVPNPLVGFAAPQMVLVDGSAFPISWRMINAATIGVTPTLDYATDDRIMVLKTANQVATSSLDTLITWNGVATPMTRGTSLQWSSGASTRITIGTSGDYVIYAHLAWENNATGQRTIYIYKNGANLKKIEVGNASTFFTQIEAVFEHPFVAGDYIEMVGVQVSGGNLNALGAGALTTADTVNRCSMIVRQLNAATGALTATATLLVLPALPRS